MSEPKFITPNNPGRMAEVNTEIREILESGECAKVKITQAAESLRTIEQNDRMWAMLGDVSKQVKWDVDGVRRYMKPREWKHVFTAALEKHQSVARGLKTLARDSGVCVVALAQSVRDCDNRNNKRPGLADIAESSDCEREADTILSIYRDEVYDPNSNDVGTAELIVCKNRHGPTGLIKLAFNGATVRFSDLAAGSVTAFRGAA